MPPCWERGAVSWKNEKKKRLTLGPAENISTALITGKESFSHRTHSVWNTLTYKHFHTRQSTSTTPKVAHIGWPWTTLETSLKMNSASYTCDHHTTFPTRPREAAQPTSNLVTSACQLKLTGERRGMSQESKVKVIDFSVLTRGMISQVT